MAYPKSVTAPQGPADPNRAVHVAAGATQAPAQETHHGMADSRGTGFDSISRPAQISSTPTLWCPSPLSRQRGSPDKRR